MRKLKIFIFFLLGFVGISSGLLAQSDSILDVPNITWILDTYQAIIAAGTVVSGFILKAFMHSKEAPKLQLAIKVFAAGIVIAGGFVLYGVTAFIPSLFTIISSMGLYDIFRALFSKPSKIKNQ